MSKIDTIKQYFEKWLKPLGLLWWDIQIAYYDDPKEILQRFRFNDEEIVLAKTYVSWIYGTANIHVNVPAFEGLSDDGIETAVVHELCHVLVNEMREGEMHHEERVVTGLTKAFMWVREYGAKDKQD